MLHYVLGPLNIPTLRVTSFRLLSQSCTHFELLKCLVVLVRRHWSWPTQSQCRINLGLCHYVELAGASDTVTRTSHKCYPYQAKSANALRQSVHPFSVVLGQSDSRSNVYSNNWCTVMCRTWYYRREVLWIPVCVDGTVELQVHARHQPIRDASTIVTSSEIPPLYWLTDPSFEAGTDPLLVLMRANPQTQSRNDWLTMRISNFHILRNCETEVTKPNALEIRKPPTQPIFY